MPTGSTDGGTANGAPPRRPVRSFVLRQGRLTPAQQRALEALWPRYGLELQGAPRDFDAVFGRTRDAVSGRTADRVLEIGVGNGEALRWAAEREPNRDFIGVEVHQPGVGRLLNALDAARLANVRVYNHDAVEVLQGDIGEDVLAEVRIWFPDPWPKKRHHKRRLLRPEFVALLASRLRRGGLLHLATDWQDYAEQMGEVLDADARFRNRAGPGGHVPRPPWRPQTHFEARGLRLGHGVWDLLYDRVG